MSGWLGVGRGENKRGLQVWVGEQCNKKIPVLFALMDTPSSVAYISIMKLLDIQVIYKLLTSIILDIDIRSALDVSILNVNVMCIQYFRLTLLM